MKTACLIVLLVASCTKTVAPYQEKTFPDKCGSHIECYNLALEKLDEVREFWKQEKENMLPAGMIVALPADVAAPPRGWLFCNGDKVKIDEHRRLHDVLGPGSDVGSGYFRVPDLRGYFLRGYDSSGAVDPDGKSRKVGDVQRDSVGPHNHRFYVPFEAGQDGSPQWDGVAYLGNFNLHRRPKEGNTDSSSDGPETRPKNVSVVFLIKD